MRGCRSSSAPRISGCLCAVLVSGSCWSEWMQQSMTLQEWHPWAPVVAAAAFFAALVGGGVDGGGKGGGNLDPRVSH